MSHRGRPKDLGVGGKLSTVPEAVAVQYSPLDAEMQPHLLPSQRRKICPVFPAHRLAKQIGPPVVFAVVMARTRYEGAIWIAQGQAYFETVDALDMEIDVVAFYGLLAGDKLTRFEVRVGHACKAVQADDCHPDTQAERLRYRVVAGAGQKMYSCSPI